MASLCTDEPVEQQCRRCRDWYDRDAFFRRKRRAIQMTPGLHISSPQFHGVCIGCETTSRTERKADDRWPEKARSTIQRHARRYKKSTNEFVRLYGWDTHRVAHLLKHAFDNTCVYCRKLYSGMQNSQWQVTMDIIDPRLPPHLETNTVPCCQTCNREKSNTPPELWARKLRMWARWEANQLKRPPGPTQLNLFCEAFVS